MHLVLVADVDERLDGLHQQGEARRGQEDADDEHDQDVDAGPAEGVLQPLLGLLGGVFVVRGVHSVLVLAALRNHGTFTSQRPGTRATTDEVGHSVTSFTSGSS